MNGKEYIQTQITMIETAKKIRALDLPSFLKCISNAETMAPILDPTLFQRASENLQAIKKLAKSFQEVQLAFDEVQDVITKSTVAFMQKKDGDNDHEHA